MKNNNVTTRNGYEFVNNITNATIAKDNILWDVGVVAVPVGGDSYWIGVIDDLGCGWLNSDDSTRLIAIEMFEKNLDIDFVCNALDWPCTEPSDCFKQMKKILMDGSHPLRGEAKVVQDIMGEVVKCIAATTLLH